MRSLALLVFVDVVVVVAVPLFIAAAVNGAEKIFLLLLLFSWSASTALTHITRASANAQTRARAPLTSQPL